MTPPGPDRTSTRLVFRKPPKGLRELLKLRCRARMVAAVIVGPAIATATFILTAYGLKSLLGRVLSVERIAPACAVYLIVWQIIAVNWLRRHWREPGAGGGT